jgi:adenine-specific DNA-methyltransferase
MAQVDPPKILQAVQALTDRTSFLQGLLGDTLGWPIPEGVSDPEEISYGWTHEDLQALDLDRSILNGRVFQLQPLKGDQPWGIFLLEFRDSTPFTMGRGVASPLRQVLRGLVPSRRRSSNLPAWRREHLLFICTNEYKHFRVAHFRAPREKGQSAPLASFGWSTGDTHIRTLCEFNLPALAWPDDPTPAAWTALWTSAFDVEAVTKQFFREIANWYFWALKHVRFPKDAPKEADGHDHVSVIRLITRLVFCWFIKEKGLIPSTLFEREELGRLLNGFAPDTPSDKGSVFYRAILQNLFFATLNTEMDKRGWARDEQNLMAHSLYRHKELFRNPGAAVELFKDIPFLNGGLFECLDRLEGTAEKPRYVRIDGFSRRSDSQPMVPDFLFFAGDRSADLSREYGEDRYQSTNVRGLMRTLSSYNFTLAENTPLDQEVALDPELLGKVFENLLAAYNPETRSTARKATGSYYTPRWVVDYMVDEALLAALTTKMPSSLRGDSTIDVRLRHLLAYSHEQHRLTEPEVDTLIRVIDHLKILDPACGSGAFPMGILHKLVFVLGKLDPGNARWKARQLAKAAEIPDATVRERVLADIEQAFTANELDYGRKLYLIENCIYGADIQPIAVQIAKLRFFISLVVDQRVNPATPNLAVRALPNLETKFVAADTLTGLERPAQMAIRDPKIDDLEGELARVRNAHFTARTPATKRKHRERDAELRTQIAGLLKEGGWDSQTGRMLAAWDPYDQNTSAPFFDAEWMFGLTAGFDVVIGNPPYINVELIDAEQKAYFKAHYQTYYKRYDVFGLFFEAALLRLASETGNVTFIVPQQIANNLSYKKLRDLILSNRWLREVLYLGDKVFEAANNDVCVLFLVKGGNESIHLVHALEFERRTKTTVPTDHFKQYGNVISFSGDAGGEAIFAKVFAVEDRWPIKKWFSVFQGIVTGNNAAFLPAAEEARAAKIEKGLLHPVLLGRDFGKWAIRSAERRILYVNGDVDIKKYPNAEKWLQPFRAELKKRRECGNGVIPWYALQWPRDKAELDHVPRILVQGTRNPRLRVRIVATIDEEGLYGTQGMNFVVPRAEGAPIHYLLAVLNSTLINYLYATKFLNVAIKAEYLKDTPIARASAQDEAALTKLVMRILAAKRKDGPAADTSALEQEIDERVYRLYGLTPEEIRLVEGTVSEASGGE